MDQPAEQVFPVLPMPTDGVMDPPGSWLIVPEWGAEPIVDVDMGDDGTLVVTTSRGVARFTGTGWEVIDNRPATRVTVADIGHIYTIIGGQPYYHTRSRGSPYAWQANRLATVSDPQLAFRDIVTSAGGEATFAIYAIKGTGRYRYEYYITPDRSEHVWMGMPLDICSSLAIGPSGTTWGIDDEHNLYKFEAPPIRFPVRGVATVRAGGDDTYWYLDMDGTLFYYLNALWIARTAPPRFTKLAVGNRLQLVGVDEENTIYRFCPDGYGPMALL